MIVKFERIKEDSEKININASCIPVNINMVKQRRLPHDSKWMDSIDSVTV